MYFEKKCGNKKGHLERLTNKLYLNSVKYEVLCFLVYAFREKCGKKLLNLRD